MSVATVNEIVVKRHHARRGWFIVSILDPDIKYGAAVSLHFDKASAMAGADKMKRDYWPAVVRDATGGPV